MRGQAGSVPEISVSGPENFSIWTLQPGYTNESGMNYTNEFCIVLSLLVQAHSQDFLLLGAIQQGDGPKEAGGATP